MQLPGGLPWTCCSENEPKNILWHKPVDADVM
jgi:hypothetical protein